MIGILSNKARVEVSGLNQLFLHDCWFLSIEGPFSTVALLRYNGTLKRWDPMGGYWVKGTFVGNSKGLTPFLILFSHILVMRLGSAIVPSMMFHSPKVMGPVDHGPTSPKT